MRTMKRMQASNGMRLLLLLATLALSQHAMAQLLIDKEDHITFYDVSTDETYLTI